MAELHVAIYSCADQARPHRSLYAQDDDGNISIFEALGSAGMGFKFNNRCETMHNDERPSKVPHIGRIEADVWPDAMELLKKVPMSVGLDWNCQSWVMEAIASLNEERYLEEEEGGMAHIKKMFHKKWMEYQS